MLYTIQICRAIAALLVVIFHSTGNLAKEKYFGAVAYPLENIFCFGGDAGVAFFFVLSGFIIYRTHHQDFNNPKKLPAYIKKRVARIYPTYIIIFLIVFIFAKSIPSLRDGVPSDPIILLKSLLLLPQDSKIVGGTGAPVIIAAWSLQYEMMFYAAFGLALIRKWLFFAVVIGVVSIFLFEAVAGPYSFPISFVANHLVLLFGMGILAGSVVKSKTYIPWSGWLSLISALAFAFLALLAVQNRETYQKPAFDLAYGVVSALLILGLSRFEAQSIRNKMARRFSIFGDASYAMYLLHFPLVSIFSKIAITVLPINAFGVSVALLFLVGGSVAAAVAFNLIIERPILRRLTVS